MKKGKERQEKVEVCCAAVGTDCRASEPRFPSRFVVLAAPAASLLLSLSFYLVLSRCPPISLSLSFVRPSLTPLDRPSGIEDLSDSSALFVGRVEGNRRTSVFLLPSASCRSSLSSCGLSFSTITSSSPDPRRRSSAIAATGAAHVQVHRDVHTHTHTHYRAHCSRGEPRLFSCPTAIPRRFHSDPP